MMCNTFLGRKVLAILLVKLRIVKDFKKKYYHICVRTNIFQQFCHITRGGNKKGKNFQ